MSEVICSVAVPDAELSCSVRAATFFCNSMTAWLSALPEVASSSCSVSSADVLLISASNSFLSTVAAFVFAATCSSRRLMSSSSEQPTTNGVADNASVPSNIPVKNFFFIIFQIWFLVDFSLYFNVDLYLYLLKFLGQRYIIICAKQIFFDIFFNPFLSNLINLLIFNNILFYTLH